MRVELINDTTALSSFESEWQKTWFLDPHADVFASPFWFMNWWTKFGQGNNDAEGSLLFHHAPDHPATVKVKNIQAHILALRNGNDLLAVFPLLLVQSQWRRCPVTLLMPALNNHSPRSGFTLAAMSPIERQLLLSTAAQGLRRLKNWDILLLDGIPSQIMEDQSSNLQLIAAQRVSIGQAWGHSYIAFDQDWDDYLRSQGGHFRKRLTKLARTITELGTIRCECMQGTKAADIGMRAFVEIDKSSWKATSGETIADDSVGSYYDSLVKRFSDAGLCHIWVLFINEEPAASFICLTHRQVIYLIKTSFKQIFSSARYAPSQVLLGYMIEHYWKAGWKGMDCVVRMPFVERWSNQEILFRPSTGHGNNHYTRMLGWLGQMRSLVRGKPEHA